MIQKKKTFAFRQIETLSGILSKITTIDLGLCHVKLVSVNRSFKRNFRRREKNVHSLELNTLQFYGTKLQ
jgi:hypothetical protein